MKDIGDIKDGFDLIEYPCDYVLKAMCRVLDDVDALQHVRALALDVLSEKELLSVSCNPSRTGKFEAITLTVRLSNRAQLESIYQNISESSMVVMTL